MSANPATVDFLCVDSIFSEEYTIDILFMICVLCRSLASLDLFFSAGSSLAI